MAHSIASAKSKKSKKRKSKNEGVAGAGADWTVMVYLAGDNNLDGAGVADLREMKKVGSSASVNVIAQFDRAGSRERPSVSTCAKARTFPRMQSRIWGKPTPATPGSCAISSAGV
jgi:hypothetical protein